MNTATDNAAPRIRYSALTETMEYPAARQFALKAKLPLVVCPVAKELYGVSNPVFDRAAAEQLCRSAGFRGEEVDHAVSVMEERAERR